MRKTQLLLGSFFLLSASACLETQTSPEIKTIPSSSYEVQTIANNLSHPWSVAQLPQNSFLVTERGGKLILIAEGNRMEISGLPDDIMAIGQGGLLDIVLAPDFETTSEIFFSYAYGNLEENGTALARAKISNSDLKDLDVIFRANPPKFAPQHFGGRIAFLPDDTIILSLGDGFALREEAQKLNTHLGKVVRLNRDGSVPENNPFTDYSESKAEIYSQGHRNVQGLVYDYKSGKLWAHEHGPRGGDELNIIQSGENYGWPIATKGTDYNGARISPFESKEGMADPEYFWVPSIAPSGLAIYHGKMFPDWEGSALIGGLASKDLRLVHIENDKAISEEKLLGELNARIRDVRLASDGSVLVLTDDPENGKLLRLIAQ